MPRSSHRQTVSADVATTVSKTIVLLKIFEKMVAASSTSEFSPAIRAAIDKITYDVARAIFEGRESVTVMALRELHNFRRQIWFKRWWMRKPTPELLYEDARAVYDYCLANGLNPTFSRYEYDYDYSQFLSSLKISWDNRQFKSNRADRSVEDSSVGCFRDSLKSLMPDEKQSEVMARARHSEAVFLMPLVVRELDAAAKAGRSEVEVYRQAVSSNLSPLNCNHIKEICEQLGLKAVVVFDLVNCKRFSAVLVSGWEESP